MAELDRKHFDSTVLIEDHEIRQRVVNFICSPGLGIQSWLLGVAEPERKFKEEDHITSLDLLFSKEEF